MSATATMARWASGVTPGARAFEPPATTVRGTVVGMSVDFVGIVELAAMLVGVGTVVGAFVLSVMFLGSEVDDAVLSVIWGSVVVVLVVCGLLVVVIG